LINIGLGLDSFDQARLRPSKAAQSHMLPLERVCVSGSGCPHLLPGFCTKGGCSLPLAIADHKDVRHTSVVPQGAISRPFFSRPKTHNMPRFSDPRSCSGRSMFLRRRGHLHPARQKRCPLGDLGACGPNLAQAGVPVPHEQGGKSCGTCPSSRQFFARSDNTQLYCAQPIRNLRMACW
jgi:hypothetical protein